MGELGKGPIGNCGMRQMKNRLDRVQNEFDYPMDVNTDPTPIQCSALTPRLRVGRAIELFYDVASESVRSVNMLVRVGTLAQRQINALAKKAFKAPVAPEPKRTGEIE